MRAHPPGLLALDTATEAMAIALCAPQGRWVVDAPGGALASQQLLPQVQALLVQAGIGMGHLQAIAFGQGPGAFTGLRTACSVAQGLALGLGCPVLALDSLMLVAEAASAHLGDLGDTLWVAMDARMDEVYAAPYQRLAPAHWQALQPPALYTLPALAAAWARQPPQAVVGSALAPHAARLPLQGVAQHAAAGGRAAALLRLAEVAWANPAAHRDAADALPLYLRDKVALTTAERAAVAA
jgi:tRNA threonylcarbamoyladenosine biosynthesis protein TsaB